MSDGTIVALATAPGAAGVAVVRLSGPSAVAVAGALFRPAGGGRFADAPPRRLVYGELRRGDELLDACLAVRFPAPASFTGEDVVEIHTHGGPLLARAVVAALLEASTASGADLRNAEPGEFTRRAFLNGKLDLVRAEAVADLIHAESEAARRAASRQLRGDLSVRIGSLRDRAAELLAACEAACDFPEEDLGAASEGTRREAARALRLDLQALVAGASLGRSVVHGARVALVGRPNAGKSSLFNALLGEERALVSPEPGTTRDWIEGRLTWRGLGLRLEDTAGVRFDAAGVEAEGVRRSLERARDCDVLVLVADGSAPLALEGAALPERGSLVVVRAKGDLPPRWGPEAVAGALRAAGRGASEADACAGALVTASAATGAGLKELKDAILEALLKGRGLDALEAVALTQARHEDAARRAVEAMGRAEAAAGPDWMGPELREALDALGEIVGAVPRAEILETIFRRFCIGK